MAQFGAQLTAILAQEPKKAAVICADFGTLSRACCLDAMMQVVAKIAKAGVVRGARIAIIAPVPRHAAIGYMACVHSHVAAPLNPDYTTSEFQFFLSDLAPEIVLIGDGASAAARTAVEQCGLRSVEISDDIFQPTQAADAFPRASAPSDAALVLHTSGTTARPKMVELSQSNLAASCSNIARSLLLTDADVSLCAMPLFHIHGLMANLSAALLSGGTVVLAGKFQAERFVDCLERYKPTWFSAVPTIQLSLIDHLERRASAVEHSLRLIRSSSASLPPSVIVRLETSFSVPVIEAYGMTEASHQIASNPLPPSVRKRGTVGLATGTRIRVLNDAGQACLAGTSGNVVIQGDGITPGYIENPAANSEAFRHGYFWTGDLGYLDDDNYLTLTGRSKEIVNRAGQKISPREIDEALMEVDGISDAVAFAQPHQSLGEDLVAAVVLRAGAGISQEEIRKALFERLADYKVPSQIAIVDEIPVGATGKRQRLHMWDALRHEFVAPFREPANVVEMIICEFMAEVLGRETISAEDNFFNLGGDSILGLRLSVTLGEVLGCHIPPTAIFRHPSPVALSVMVHDGLSATDLARLEAAVAGVAENSVELRL